MDSCIGRLGVARESLRRGPAAGEGERTRSFQSSRAFFVSEKIIARFDPCPRTQEQPAGAGGGKTKDSPLPPRASSLHRFDNA